MALLHFTTNRPADDPTAIHSACHFDQTDGSSATTTAGQENPRPLRLSSSTTASSPNASLNPILTSPEHSRILTDLSPSNPAILLARSSTDPDQRPFVCAAITIVSSARTMELYISGEYSGTFRGESFLPSDPSFTPVISAPGGTGGGPASPPLFLIQIDQENLLHRCRNLVFKFFIPKKPTAFQDSLSLHWLIVQGALPPPSPSFSLSNHGPTSQNSLRQPATATSSSPAVHIPITMPAFPSPLASLSSTSTQPGNPPSLTQTDTTGATITTAANNVDPTATTTAAYNDVSTTPASHISSGYFTSSSQNFESQTSLNFSAFASAHPYMMSSGISTSIDLDKVRQMLSQVQIDNMPQGAKDLMRNMEMQFLAQQQQQQQRTTASSVATGEYLSPSPLGSPLPPLPPPSSPSLLPPPAVTSILIPPSESATVAAAVGETAAFVTKTELALMEERIMTKIEQQFQEMEDRILNKLLLATKLPNA